MDFEPESIHRSRQPAVNMSVSNKISRRKSHQNIVLETDERVERLYAALEGERVQLNQVFNIQIDLITFILKKNDYKFLLVLKQ